MLGFLLYGGSGTGELAEAGNGVRQWALCKISMKDSVGVVIWIPSALSPYDLLSAFRLRCTVDLAVAAKRIETDFNGSRFDQTFQTGPKSVQPY